MNFTPSEFTRTSTGLDNTPNDFALWRNIIHTADKIQAVRNSFGKAIYVDCGYRSPAVNKAVGGVATSAHLQGLAADIRASSGLEADNRLLYALIKKMMAVLKVDQLIMYNSTAGDTKTKIRFLHVGFRLNDDSPRMQLLFK